MLRLRSAPLAIAAVLLSAGAVAAVTTPSAATKGLGIAAEHSGRTVPVGPASTDVTVAPQADTDAAADVAADAPTADLPDAAAHGAAVSAAAKAADVTPDTNHGADVSAVARANHGQTVAASHKATDAGKPDGVGRP